MISKLEKLLGPIANKLAQQRHLQAISSGMMMSLGSVSYTHLDVYKRQILGGTQSGFIDSIGFEMYMKILQDAINEKMGKEDVEAEKEIKSVNVKVDGYIPHDYVSSDIEKLELYQRLDNAKTISGVDHLKSEFIDYYGKLPEEVKMCIRDSV